jgi:hypothetical protein
VGAGKRARDGCSIILEQPPRPRTSVPLTSPKEVTHAAVWGANALSWSREGQSYSMIPSGIAMIPSVIRRIPGCIAVPCSMGIGFSVIPIVRWSELKKQSPRPAS